MENIDQILRTTQELVAKFGWNIVAAILIFIVGGILSKRIAQFIKKWMLRSNIDPTLVSFTSNLTRYGLLVFVIIAGLNRLGVQTASLIAVLGGAAIAVGLALQGSLSNFAAGVLIVIFRPFKVGEYIEAAGYKGKVEDIALINTTIVAFDNTVAIVPNASIIENNILNFSRKSTRRVDRVVGISYSDNIDKARQVILDELKKDKRVFSDPPPRSYCIGNGG